MNYPEFYDRAPRISMRDPLAALLGASDELISADPQLEKLVA